MPPHPPPKRHGTTSHKWRDGKPTHVVHRLPDGTTPCRFFSLEITKNDSMLQLFEGDSLRPRRHSGKHQHEPRITEINATFSFDVVMKEIRLSLDSSKVEFVGRPASVLMLRDAVLTPAEVEVVSYYQRRSKRKVLNAFYFVNEDPPASIQWALVRYDHFYALDTNTWTFEGVGRISACVVVHGRTGPISADHSAGGYEVAYAKIDNNVEGNPEMGAIRDLITLVQSQLPVLPSRPIGVIVDSELGRLKDINAGRMPVIDEFFLPPGFEMVHATDASGATEYLTNQMIRACDAAATTALKQYQAEQRLIRVAP